MRDVRRILKNIQSASFFLTLTLSGMPPLKNPSNCPGTTHLKFESKKFESLRKSIDQLRLSEHTYRVLSSALIEFASSSRWLTLFNY